MKKIVTKVLPYSKISIVIPTYNEQTNIKKALRSIYQQNYPKKFLEIIIVDDNSTDETLKIATKFPVRVLKNGAYDGEVGKMIGMNAASGDFFYYFDADMELRGKDFFQSMLKPFLYEKDIVGVFTRNYAKRNAPSLERYFAMDPIHRDPVYEFFSPSVESTIVEEKNGYKLCKYSPDKIPPAARCLYKMKEIRAMTKGKKKFMELDILKLFVKDGKSKFGYVPLPGKYHHHAKNIRQLLHKRRRNVGKVYLSNINEKEYKWFNLRSSKDVIKILLLVIYANTFVFSTARGIYKSVKFRDIAGLWEPIVAFLVTNTIILSFLMSKNGIKFIFGSYFGKLKKT